MKIILRFLVEKDLKAYIVFGISFLISIFLLGDHFINLTSLKREHERVIGVITKVDSMYKQSLRIQYNYNFMENTYRGRALIPKRLLRFSFGKEYRVAERINIFVNPNNRFTFIEEELTQAIFRRAALILIIPFFALFIAKVYFSNREDKKAMKSTQKAYYQYYVQGNDYTIKRKKIGKTIYPTDIVQHIEFNALKNNEIICCGIEKGNNFVELTFFEDEFELRMFYQGKEKTKIIKDESEISETIYRHLTKGNKRRKSISRYCQVYGKIR